MKKLLDYVPLKGHSTLMKKVKWLAVIMSDQARKEIHSWSEEIKKDLGSILTKLQKGDPVGYPDT